MSGFFNIVQPQQPPVPEVVPVHSVAQWQVLSPQVQLAILQNIKLKERLHNWITKRQDEDNEKKLKGGTQESRWVECHSCVGRGWTLKQPRYPGIHPSAFGSACLLKIYNEMKEKPSRSKFEPRKQLIFDYGTALHDMLQEYGRRGAWGPKYQKEVRISSHLQEVAQKLYLEGSADAVNYLEVTIGTGVVYEVKIVHEYKSMNSNNFKKLTGPLSYHQTQATIYLGALDSPIAVYLYMNKDDSNLADFPLAFNQELWHTLYNKGEILVQHYDADTPPPATTGFHCQDCQYVFDCPAAKEKAAALKRK